MSSSSYLPTIITEQQIKCIRQKILGQLIPERLQVAASATTADLDNDQTADESIHTTEMFNNTKKIDAKFENKIIIHYTHEKRSHSFKRDVHRIYNQTFANKTRKDIKMIVGNRNHRECQKRTYT